ncbi:MFS general substrate transporter [Marasmius fiardii PR-910]|nr:MFS general substrate transporter [Marasmius fiardii PR-910]
MLNSDLQSFTFTSIPWTQVGGLLASGLLTVGDIGIVRSWRKMFLIGIITTGIGLICFLILPNDPRNTRMLNEEEQRLALARIDADQPNAGTKERTEKASFALVLRSFNLSTSLCFALLNITFQGLSLLMPTVVASLGRFTVVESQLRTVPPYLHRTGFILISILFVITGYAIAIGTKEPHARYAACFLSISGASNTGTTILAWATENSAPDTVKAVTSALIPGVGSLGSIIAVWTYLPDYHKGNSLNLATSILSGMLVLLLFAYIRWENAKRERGERNYRLEGKDGKEIEELGYLHPGFRYQV